MRYRNISVLVGAILFTVTATGAAWAIGLPIQKTKEELGLRYELSAVARNDQVMITLKIQDLGELAPLEGVVLIVRNKDSKSFEVCIPLAIRQRDGESVAWCRLDRKLAERATLELIPKVDPSGQPIWGWVFYPIPIVDHITDSK